MSDIISKKKLIKFIQETHDELIEGLSQLGGLTQIKHEDCLRMAARVNQLKDIWGRIERGDFDLQSRRSRNIRGVN